MTAPVNSNKIEDVLLSIRRLIAQDAKIADHDNAPSLPVTKQKLLLSPELRVQPLGRAAPFSSLNSPLPQADAAQRLTMDDAKWALGAAASPSVPTDDEMGGNFVIDPDARLFDVAPTDIPQHHGGDLAMGAQGKTAISQFNTGAGAVRSAAVMDMNGNDPLISTDALDPQIMANKAVEDAVLSQANEALHADQTVPNPVIDAVVLRGMVQAIVREEMAGPLGMRITHSIHKLVRAEVARILAARNLD